MEVKPGFQDKEKVSLFYEWRRPFNRGKRYRDCVSIFAGPNFVSPKWRCPLYTGVLEERFHCISNVSYLTLVAGMTNGFTFQTSPP